MLVYGFDITRWTSHMVSSFSVSCKCMGAEALPTCLSVTGIAWTIRLDRMDGTRKNLLDVDSFVICLTDVHLFGLSTNSQSLYIRLLDKPRRCELGKSYSSFLLLLPTCSIHTHHDTTI